MIETIFRQMFGMRRQEVVEIIRRLTERLDKNEKLEYFLLKKAEQFPKDPRGTIQFVFFFGVVLGYWLFQDRNQETLDMFTVSRKEEIQ